MLMTTRTVQTMLHIADTATHSDDDGDDVDDDDNCDDDRSVVCNGGGDSDSTGGDGDDEAGMRQENARSDNAEAVHDVCGEDGMMMMRLLVRRLMMLMTVMGSLPASACTLASAPPQ